MNGKEVIKLKLKFVPNLLVKKFKIYCKKKKQVKKNTIHTHITRIR